ncbi:hypothetical protein IQ226_22035 [Dolichospermum sp. LEGE 00240]|uniref:hypothetical protein n=1 Tax=Dolichospermum sp. LEGE 00240 TaxID=1828603 RepID=UPI001881FC26|nr:hypothetical protein [Dolichospermum sp. LEGE 00240]MDM3848215.1 hypothetical protein [Aphanizomenon gracile PMC638.10]MDM3850291.1 hypothetical protein [Aphanizomenon gracile PMC627.10]MDM3855019.1 hypothetical protein [Aphanizomenon gracile PMC649.10]MDM3862822.1 hypothetical protein [Aphanizomenon gracile PMC644.10]MBE9251738.1 hypothetical protein [Dolichospermum sp. LEGE 00240]
MQLSGYPQFSKSDKEKCTYFETPSAKTWHFFVIKIRETLINKLILALFSNQINLKIMANKSHFNSGHIAINMQKKNGIIHSSSIAKINVDNTKHGIFNV